MKLDLLEFIFERAEALIAARTADRKIGSLVVLIRIAEQECGEPAWIPEDVRLNGRDWKTWKLPRKK